MKQRSKVFWSSNWKHYSFTSWEKCRWSVLFVVIFSICSSSSWQISLSRCVWHLIRSHDALHTVDEDIWIDLQNFCRFVSVFILFLPPIRASFNMGTKRTSLRCCLQKRKNVDRNYILSWFCPLMRNFSFFVLVSILTNIIYQYVISFSYIYISFLFFLVSSSFRCLFFLDSTSLVKIMNACLRAYVYVCIILTSRRCKTFACLHHRDRLCRSISFLFYNVNFKLYTSTPNTLAMYDEWSISLLAFFLFSLCR